MRRPIAPPTVDPTMLKIEALAYIVVESADPARWQTFAEQMLGMQAVAQGSGLFLQMDERDFRISVVKGESDRYLASGWLLHDRPAFDATVGIGRASCRASGVQDWEYQAGGVKLKEK